MRTLIPLVLVAFAPLLAAQTSGGSSVKPTKGAAIRVSGSSANDLKMTRITFGASPTESAPLLSGIKLLGIELVGRTTLSDLATSGGRVVEVASGVVAIQLPGPAAIRVFHYQRPANQTFGFLALRGAGELQVLIELPGLGPTKTVDPFDPTIGVATDGATIAIAASDPKSGPTGLGDAWIARADGSPLANGQVVAELTGPAFKEIDAASLTFFGGMLYAASDGAIERAPANGAAPFTAVAMPPSGGAPITDVTGEFVVSGDGSTMAVLAGSDETLLDLYRFDAAGAVSKVTQQPQPFSDPGFLPAATDGPHFALSHDGSVAIYEVDFPLGNELFIQSFAAGATAHQLTKDQEFDHSIDQMSGILTGGSFVRFLAASGQQNADLYRASLPVAGVPQLKNLTQTSGSPDPWFPNAATMQVTAQVNLRGGRLMLDDQTLVGGAGKILRFSGATDATGVVLAGLTADPRFVAAPIAPATLGVVAKTASETTLFAFDGLNAPRPLLAVPAGIELTALAARDGGFTYGVVADAGALGDFVVQIAANGAAQAVVGGSSFANARSLLYARNGSLLFVADNASGLAQTFVATQSFNPASPAGNAANVAFWLR
jgi:hypothetical protein